MPSDDQDLSHLSRSRQLQAYLWLCWCCARAGQKKKTVACDNFLTAWCSETLVEGEPGTGGAGFGYWASRDCLWIMPTSKPVFRAQRGFSLGVLRTLYRGKTIYDSLTEFASSPTAVGWKRERKLRWNKHLREDKWDVFVRIAGQGIRAVRYRGELIVGYDEEKPGVVLVGTRDVPGVSGLSPSERYFWLCQPEGAVVRHPAERAATWWSAEREAEFAAWATSANPGTLRAVVEDLLRGPDGQVPRIGLVGEKVAATEWGDAQDVVFASACDWLTTATEVLRGLTAGAVQPLAGGHRVFAREHFAAYLSVRPWVWSKYFGRDAGFSVVRNDDAHLADALLPRDAVRDVVCSPDAPEHPSLQGVRLGLGGLVELVGHPGTGKTTALYHLLRREGRDCVVVLVRTKVEPSWVLLDALVRDVLVPSRLRVVFVLDDLQFVLPGRTSVFSRVLSLCEHVEASGGLSPCVVVSYWTCDRPGILGAFGRLLVGDRAPLTVALDRPSEEFGRSLLRSYLAVRGESLSDEKVGWLVGLAQQMDMGVRGLVDAVVRFGDGVESGPLRLHLYSSMDRGVQEFMPWEHSQYWLLAARGLSPPELVLLRIVRCYCDCGRYFLPLDLLERYVVHFGFEGSLGVVLRREEFLSTLWGLEERSWVVVRDGRVYTDHVRLVGVVVSRAFVASFVRWSAEHWSLLDSPEAQVFLSACMSSYVDGRGWHDFPVVFQALVSGPTPLESRELVFRPGLLERAEDHFGGVVPFVAGLYAVLQFSDKDLYVRALARQLPVRCHDEFVRVFLGPASTLADDLKDMARQELLTAGRSSDTR